MAFKETSSEWAAYRNIKKDAGFEHYIDLAEKHIRNIPNSTVIELYAKGYHIFPNDIIEVAFRSSAYFKVPDNGQIKGEFYITVGVSKSTGAIDYWEADTDAIDFSDDFYTQL